jgi:hypothetical protein
LLKKRSQSNKDPWKFSNLKMRSLKKDQTFEETIDCKIEDIDLGGQAWVVQKRVLPNADLWPELGLGKVPYHLIYLKEIT